MALIDVAVFTKENQCNHLEALLLSSIKKFLPLIGYELDFEITADPINLFLPFIVANHTSGLDICIEFSQLQSTFNNFEDATTSLEFSDEDFWFLSSLHDFKTLLGFWMKSKGL